MGSFGSILILIALYLYMRQRIPSYLSPQTDSLNAIPVDEDEPLVEPDSA